MYELTYGGEVLHGRASYPSVVTNVVETFEDSAAGDISFSMHPGHPLYDVVREANPLATLVLTDDGETLFEGDVDSISTNLDGVKTVAARGCMSWLNDVVVDVDYSTSEADGATVTAPSGAGEYFEWLVNIYNMHAPATRRFVVGRNEAAQLARNGTVCRASSQYPTVADEISDKLLTQLGGHLRVRFENGVRYLDYTVGGADPFAKTVEYGKNLMDYQDETDALDVCTCVVPVGKAPEESTSASGAGDVASKLYLTEYPDGAYEDMWKDGKRLWYPDAVAEYGYHETLIETEDETLDGLIESAAAHIRGNCSPVRKITVKGIDLGVQLRGGEYVRVVIKPKGLDTYMLCSSAKLDLDNPANDEFELGITYSKLTGAQDPNIAKLNEQVNHVYESIESGVIDTAKAAYDKAVAAQGAAETAQSAATEAHTAATEAGKTAGAAQSAADEANATAATAQSTADKAKADVATAQSTADTAKSDAATAQSAATTAQSAADEAKDAATAAQSTAATAQSAAKTAQSTATAAQSTAATAQLAADAAAATANATASYFFADGEGAHVASAEGDAGSGGNVLIKSDGMQVRSGTSALATFGAKLVEIGKNASDAIVKLCNGNGYIKFDQDDSYLRTIFGAQPSSGDAATKRRWAVLTASDLNDDEEYAPAIICQSGDPSDPDDEGMVIISATDVLFGTNGDAVPAAKLQGICKGDYVTKQGRDGIWTYRIWASGYAELWGTYTASGVKFTSAWGSVYESSTSYTPPAFPFEFAETPSMTATAMGNGNNNIGVEFNSPPTKTNPPTFYLLRPTSASGEHEHKVSMSVKGWVNYDASSAIEDYPGMHMLDYVIEQGTSGIWEFRKWASGKAELWGIAPSFSTPCNIAWGASYYGEVPAGKWAYPFAFAETPWETIDVLSTGCWIIPYGGNSTTGTGGFYLVSAQSYSSYTTRGARIYVAGRWR